MSLMMTKESELRLHWAELQELEQKVVELIATALKLAPGLERRDSLVVIGSFRARIDGMKRSELARASTLHSLNTACERPFALSAAPSGQTEPPAVSRVAREVRQCAEARATFPPASVGP